MHFPPENPVVKCCAEGMEAEGRGEPETAKRLFCEAWENAADDFEKFIAAHYVARHQESVQQKLEWDKTALAHALNVNDAEIKGQLPSLYLNIGKGYEDLREMKSAAKQYALALSYAEYLPEDGYGRMIRAGIEHGLKRISLSSI